MDDGELKIFLAGECCFQLLLHGGKQAHVQIGRRMTGPVLKILFQAEDLPRGAERDRPGAIMGDRLKLFFKIRWLYDKNMHVLCCFRPFSL